MSLARAQLALPVFRLCRRALGAPRQASRPRHRSFLCAYPPHKAKRGKPLRFGRSVGFLLLVFFFCFYSKVKCGFVSSSLVYFFLYVYLSRLPGQCSRALHFGPVPWRFRHRISNLEISIFFFFSSGAVLPQKSPLEAFADSSSPLKKKIFHARRRAAARHPEAAK